MHAIANLSKRNVTFITWRRNVLYMFVMLSKRRPVYCPTLSYQFVWSPRIVTRLMPDSTAIKSHLVGGVVHAKSEVLGSLTQPADSVNSSRPP